MATISLVDQLNQANSDLDALNKQYDASKKLETDLYQGYYTCKTWAGNDAGDLEQCWQGEGQFAGHGGAAPYAAAVENSNNILTAIGLKKAQITQIQQSINSDPVAKQSLEKQQSNETITKTVTYTILGLIVFVIVFFVVKKYIL